MSSRKILLVEDDKMLTTVYEMYLKDLGHQVVGIFHTADAALQIIDSILPELILLDIHLPGSIDGIQAASIFQKDYNIPVVYISSYTDENTVNKAIETHSYGYLVKPLDKTALRITIDLAYEKHRYEKTYHIHQHLLKNADVSIIGISLTSKITFWNYGSTSLFGLDSDFMTGKSIKLLFPELSDEQIQYQIIEPTLTKKKHTYTTIIPDKEFKPRTFTFNFQINSNKNDIFGLICIVHTNKNAEHEKTLNYKSAFKSLLNNIPKSLIFIDGSFSILTFNGTANHFFRKVFNKELFHGINILDVFTIFESQEINSLFKNSFEGVTHFLERCSSVNNISFFFEIIIFPIIGEDENSIREICISIKDISEVKRLEKELDETRTEIKPLFDSSIQRFYLCDLNFGLVSFNKSAKDIIIKEFNRVLRKGDNILDFIPSEINKQEFVKHFNEVKKGANIFYKNHITSTDSDYWLETHIDPILNDKGEIYRILVWTIDVTEREANMMELRETQDRYSLVAKGGNDGIWDWDMVNNVVYLSPRWKNLLGYEDHELKNEFGVRDSLIHPDDFEKDQETTQKYINNQISEFQNEIRLRHKNGHYIWVIERGELLRDDNEKPIRFAGSITDISNLKNIESEISLTNKMLLQERNMFIQGNVVIARVKIDDVSRTIYISDNVEPILGYKPEEFYNNQISYDKIIFPDDLEFHKKERIEALEKNESHVAYSPYRLIGKQGQIIWIKDFATFIRDENGEIIEILGYFVDFTSEKKWEQALFDNQKKYYSLFNEANDGIFIIDNQIITDANSKVEEMFDYTRDELINQNTLMLSPEFQPDGILSEDKRKKKIRGAVEEQKSTFYWQYKRKDNSLFDSEVSVSAVLISDKKYLHVSIRDITERKNIERSLKISEQKYKHLLDAIPDLIFIIDKTGKYTYFKPDYKQELASANNNIVGKSINDFFKNEKLEEFKGKLQLVLETSNVQKLQYELDSPKGINSFEARLSCLSQDEALMIVRIIEDLQ